MSGTLLHDDKCYKTTRIDLQTHKHTLQYLLCAFVTLPPPSPGHLVTHQAHYALLIHSRPTCTSRTTPTNTRLQVIVPHHQTFPAKTTRIPPPGLLPASSISFPTPLCPTFQLHTRQARTGHTLPGRDGSRGGLTNSHKINRKSHNQSASQSGGRSHTGDSRDLYWCSSSSILRLCISVGGS
jgi:hypothetical protein